MSIIHFGALPLPHYINSGFSLAGAGRKHPERYAVGEFDLLVVKQGCLYVGEEDRHYEVSAGHALILRPDLHHYPTEGCRELTASYWLHFHTLGDWWMSDHLRPKLAVVAPSEAESEQPIKARTFRLPEIELQVPQFTRLPKPADLYERLHRLHLLERDNHRDEVRWAQQLLFQEVLQQLTASIKARAPRAPGAEIADQAASYLREHYQSRITADDVGAALSFHPVYIARCMQKQFGCSPMEYLLRYRLDQAKHLLLQTDLSIHQIAEDVGFQQPAYFTACFGKQEGRTPREYRQQFIRQ